MHLHTVQYLSATSALSGPAATLPCLLIAGSRCRTRGTHRQALVLSSQALPAAPNEPPMEPAGSACAFDDDIFCRQIKGTTGKQAQSTPGPC